MVGKTFLLELRLFRVQQRELAKDVILALREITDLEFDVSLCLHIQCTNLARTQLSKRVGMVFKYGATKSMVGESIKRTSRLHLSNQQFDILVSGMNPVFTIHYVVKLLAVRADRSSATSVSHTYQVRTKLCSCGRTF